MASFAILVFKLLCCLCTEMHFKSVAQSIVNLIILNLVIIVNLVLFLPQTQLDGYC